MSSFCAETWDASTYHCGICQIPLLALLKPSPQTQNLISDGGRHRDYEKSMDSSIPTPHFTNHESLPPMEQSFSSFIQSFPRYLETEQADRIREAEYSHLSVSDHVCLDYVGHGLFSGSQNNTRSPDAAAAASTSSSPGVHHPTPDPFFEISHNSVSLKVEVQHGSGCSESELGSRIMKFMNVSDEEYGVVYTANEASAFKLVADCYPFRTNRNLLTVYDHQNDAVEAMTKAAFQSGARVSSAEFSWPEFRIQKEKLQRKIAGKKRKKSNNGTTLNDRGLFVFPAQSRVTGARYSYLWMNVAQENGWHILLDASALAPKEMETLGLSLFNPDFLICSFYKVFGENPSGFGCLIVRKSIAASILRDSDKPTSLVRLNAPASSLEFRGLDHADELGLIAINARARLLVNWLVYSLIRLRHPSSGGEGVQLVRIYGPAVEFDRGTAVAFHVFDWRGERIDPVMVQKLAGRKGISLGCGSLRNVVLPDKRDGSGIPVVTAAIGMVTNFEDVYKVWGFVSRFLDADFVEKERWRYTALNQTTVEV